MFKIWEIITIHTFSMLQQVYIVLLQRDKEFQIYYNLKIIGSLFSFFLAHFSFKKQT